MTNELTPEHRRAVEATEKMVAAYTKDMFTAYQCGKAEEGRRIWEALGGHWERFSRASGHQWEKLDLSELELKQIIFGGGDVD